MRIIKHGNKYLAKLLKDAVTCPECGCVFLYLSEKDLKTIYNEENECNEYFANCPECNHLIQVFTDEVIA